MEAEAQRQLAHHHQGLPLSLPAQGIPGLDVVRALHQTVVSLRSALDSSREEIRILKNHHHPSSSNNNNNNFDKNNLNETSDEPTQATLNFDKLCNILEIKMSVPDENPTITVETVATEIPELENSEPDIKASEEESEKIEINIKAPEQEEQKEQSVEQEQAEKLTVEKKDSEDSEEAGVKTCPESENESEEVDDIELIFTTEESCRDIGLQEDLVSINPENEKSGLLCNGKASSVEDAVSSPSSSIDREESVDRFDEVSSDAGRLNKIWSQCSVLVETDISKCGVLEDSTAELNSKNQARRNTLATPIQQAYRPIIHREALNSVRRKSVGTPLRPLVGGNRRDSSVQTDISALPAQWRSESYLAHKVAHSFTTLPSKFALPQGVSSGKLRLSEKTKEARRVMLSDIGFTSMVPELSRSADHLCIQEAQARAARSLQQQQVIGGGPTSPCECRNRSSMFSIPSPGGVEQRRQCWRPTGSSLDTWRTPRPNTTGRMAYFSVPCSPTSLKNHVQQRRTKSNSKVTFQDCPMTVRGSLPNLLLEHGNNSGGDESTESLVDEAEDFLRRSIDSMLTVSTDYCCKYAACRRRRTRRHSEPDLQRDWNPPQGARPYLPRSARELKLDHLVKVISPENKILQGRVRYVGPVCGQEDIYVGIELPKDIGNSDGTFQGTRFFDCKSHRALFVPFKKVVLAWCTT